MISILLILAILNCSKALAQEACVPTGDILSETILLEEGLEAYVVLPDCHQAKDRSLIVIHDILGFESLETRLVVDQIAEAGYVAIMVDFFRGHAYQPGEDIDRFVEHMEGEQARINADLDTALALARGITGQFMVGVVGFCWGGTQTVLASALATLRVQAGFVFYGSEAMPGDALRMKAPTMLVFGDQDEVIPMERVHRMEAVLRDSNRLLNTTDQADYPLFGPAARVKVFPGMGHSFAHRPTHATIRAANEAFDDMYQWFDKYLYLHWLE